MKASEAARLLTQNDPQIKMHRRSWGGVAYVERNPMSETGMTKVFPSEKAHLQRRPFAFSLADMTALDWDIYQGQQAEPAYNPIHPHLEPFA